MLRFLVLEPVGPATDLPTHLAGLPARSLTGARAILFPWTDPAGDGLAVLDAIAALPTPVIATILLGLPSPGTQAGLLAVERLIAAVRRGIVSLAQLRACGLFLPGLRQPAELAIAVALLRDAGLTDIPLHVGLAAPTLAHRPAALFAASPNIVAAHLNLAALAHGMGLRPILPRLLPVRDRLAKAAQAANVMLVEDRRHALPALMIDPADHPAWGIGGVLEAWDAPAAPQANPDPQASPEPVEYLAVYPADYSAAAATPRPAAITGSPARAAG